MILVAESGSSKTEWILANKNSIVAQYNSKGLNPYFVSSEDISLLLQNEIIPALKNHIPKKIYFYGAGCSTNANKQIIFSGFRKVFNQTNIEVDHDLMAACRALFYNSKGIACILGTGSNACIFNGNSILHKANSLGYILGDNGSGTDIGKHFLTAYFNNELPFLIAEKFENEYHISLEQVLDNVYKKPFPNRYLASFSPFIKQNIDNVFVFNMVKKSFIDFFNKMILKLPEYKTYPIGFVGSIAYTYKEILMQVSKEFGFSEVTIIKNPANELIKYHQKIIDDTL